jgi:hypothetical protein
MTLVSTGERITCKNNGCHRHMGVVEDGFIEIMYQHLHVLVSGKAHVRLQCPSCRYVSHYRLLTDTEDGDIS